MIHKNNLSKLLRILVSVIDELSEEEMDQLITGKGKLSFSPVTKQKPEAVKSVSVDSEEIVRQLNECTTREEAKGILSNIAKKEELTAIAKSLKLHIVKYDRREDIENKLVEFLIGAKLRKEAISSLNMKGGTENG